MSIQFFQKNIKTYKKPALFDSESLLLMFIILLVGAGSFGLGMIAEKEKIHFDNKESIADENQVLITSDVLLYNQKDMKEYSNLDERNFFASRNGTVYYPVGCLAGNRIAEENKIYFAQQQEAILSGFKQSTSCTY